MIQRSTGGKNYRLLLALDSVKKPMLSNLRQGERESATVNPEKEPLVSLPLIGFALALLVVVALVEGRVTSFRKFRRVSFLVRNTILENGFNSTQRFWCKMIMVVARDVSFAVDVLGNASVATLGLLGFFSNNLVDRCVALELLFSEAQILYIFLCREARGDS